MYENISINNPNFCIGPQAGTYCSVDNEVDPVVLHIKNESGTLIRTYDFFPQDILVTGPYNYGDSGSVAPNYFHHEFISIKYIGPRDQDSFFDGAVFYTLEKRAQLIRKYYTYERDPEPFGQYKYENGSLVTDTRVEYNSNIIRRWVLDTANARLELNQTFIKNSNTSDWFDSNTFSIQNVVAPMVAHAAIGSEDITLTTTSGLKKYDVLMLGPSSDMDNVGAIEEVYIHDIVGDTVTVKTYEGYIPPKYDYVSGDMVTSFKDILLFSNSRPEINSSNIAYGNTSSSGTLYRLDQTNYGSVLHREYSGMFSDINVSTWNPYFDTLSFVKGTNLLHLDLDTYEVQLSQNIGLEYIVTSSLIMLYDIDIKGITIYKLQDKIIQRDDAGQYTIMNWSTYNYHADSLVPYTCSVSLEASKKILLINGITYITLIVRDQFGVGLLDKNIWFTTEGDSGSVIVPSDGYTTSNANGVAVLRYDAGNYVDALTSVSAQVDGSNVTHGSAYVVATIHLTQHSEYVTDVSIKTVSEKLMSTSVFTKKYFITNITLPSFSMFGTVMAGALMTVRYPMFHSKGESESFSEIYIFQSLSYISDINLLARSDKYTERYLSQNFVSRHLLYGHTDNASLDQYRFVQESIPTMWSEKNNVDTDYWIRLRPFAYNLNPTTLTIKFKEDSYLGYGMWEDITDKGSITMFDAGGGLLGIDFFYDPINVFRHNAIVYVDIEVYDIATIPNKIILSYWFKLIQDYKAPYIDNHYPSIEDYNVAINTNISFDLIDVGAGVDINTLEVFINERSTEFTYIAYEHGNYHINCELPYVFHYSQTVNIVVDVKDRSSNINRLYDGWKFYCTESSAPWFNMDNTQPELCVEGTERTQAVSMQVYGIDDTGIKYDSIRLEVGGRYRNIKIIPIVYRLS